MSSKLKDLITDLAGLLIILLTILRWWINGSEVTTALALSGCVGLALLLLPDGSIIKFIKKLMDRIK